MLKSLGYRFFIVGLLILLMIIPVMFVGDIINERADYNRDTRQSVGQEWGGRQALSGPVLIIPVQETVMVREKREVLDPETGIQKLDGDEKPIYRFVNVQRTLRRNPVYLYPGDFNADIATRTEQRSRGIFTVPVYSADAELTFDFPTQDAESVLSGDEILLWDEAELHVSVTSNRALRGAAVLKAGDEVLQMEPRALNENRVGGVRAVTGDPRKHDAYSLSLDFNGAETLSIAPVGRNSVVRYTSDWPHPSFNGPFLPDGHKITEAGFEATWSIPHLARPLPQLSREDQDYSARRDASFGVELYQPNDFYQKSYRAARYGILFIGLTFLTIFLIEGQTKKPTHPVQYILVGLVQSTFFLLMLSLAEQMGFGTAYLIAAGATVSLITAFGVMALKLGIRSLVLGLLLSVLYGVLYLILRSADYALLAGSVLAFAAIAGTMFATRNENWYGAPKDPGQYRGWFGRRAAATAAPSVSTGPTEQGPQPQG
jgi:inner membrane protein